MYRAVVMLFATEQADAVAEHVLDIQCVHVDAR